jgi:hypothetical protein
LFSFLQPTSFQPPDRLAPRLLPKRRPCQMEKDRIVTEIRIHVLLAPPFRFIDKSQQCCSQRTHHPHHLRTLTIAAFSLCSTFPPRPHCPGTLRWSRHLLSTPRHPQIVQHQLDRFLRQSQLSQLGNSQPRQIIFTARLRCARCAVGEFSHDLASRRRIRLGSRRFCFLRSSSSSSIVFPA